MKNKLHIKFLEKQWGIFPESFVIMAPIEAVNTINGAIPQSYLYEGTGQEYLDLRQKYY